MKKLLLVVTLILIVLAIVYRQRLYVLDPLATVTRGGGVTRGVYINFSNDVLVLSANTGTSPQYLIQNWNRVPEIPTTLTCHRFFCLTDADHATAAPVPTAHPAQVAMSSRQVTFVDATDTPVLIKLY